MSNIPVGVVGNNWRPVVTQTFSITDHNAEQSLLKYRQRIARLEADLQECLEYFEERFDVVDGSYGEPAPNREMRLGQMLDETLNGRPV